MFSKVLPIHAWHSRPRRGLPPRTVAESSLKCESQHQKESQRERFLDELSVTTRSNFSVKVEELYIGDSCNVR